MNHAPSSSTAIHRLNRRQFIQYSCISIGSSLIAACANSNQQLSTNSDLDKVTFGTNWITQAEHSGFYQAIATGIYKNPSY